MGFSFLLSVYSRPGLFTYIGCICILQGRSSHLLYSTRKADWAPSLLNRPELPFFNRLQTPLRGLL